MPGGHDVGHLPRHSSSSACHLTEAVPVSLQSPSLLNTDRSAGRRHASEKACKGATLLTGICLRNL
jgi:hypothetical protein